MRRAQAAEPGSGRTRVWSLVWALTVAALALYALVGGQALLRLVAAEAGGDTQALRALQANPFVGVAALHDLAISGKAADPVARARDLEALLASAPLNSGAWLDLAIARRAAGEDLERVIEAVAMSTRTGPREAKAMAGRAEFALPFWSALPSADRAALVDDFGGVGRYLEPPQRERIARLIAIQAPQDAAQICERLVERNAAKWYECAPH